MAQPRQEETFLYPGDSCRDPQRVYLGWYHLTSWCRSEKTKQPELHPLNCWIPDLPLASCLPLVTLSAQLPLTPVHLSFASSPQLPQPLPQIQKRILLGTHIGRGRLALPNCTFVCAEVIYGIELHFMRDPSNFRTLIVKDGNIVSAPYCLWVLCRIRPIKVIIHEYLNLCLGLLSMWVLLGY